MRIKFAYTTIGIGGSYLRHSRDANLHDCKSDFDGIKNLVLRGREEVLRTCRSVLIEVNDDIGDPAQSCSDLLTQAALTLKSKDHSDDMAAGRFANVYDQIWEWA